MNRAGAVLAQSGIMRLRAIALVDSKAVLKRFSGDAAVKAALLSVRTSSLPLHTRVVKLCLEHGKVQLLDLYTRLLRYKL
mgnify:CR=1 FL=1